MRSTDDQLGNGELKPPTLMRALIVRQHWQKFRAFEVQFKRAARELAERDGDSALAKLTISSRQWERWYSGNVKTEPYPDACLVLEYLFGYPIKELLAPSAWADEGRRHSRGSSAGATAEAQNRPAASLGASFDSGDRVFGDSDYLQSIRSHIREIVALDNRFGGADLVRLSARFFRSIHDQLGAGTYDPGLEHDLQSAAGELAEVVGWLAYDSEAHDLARRMNQEALYFSRLAGDKVIELLTLQNSSMHAASRGRPREALQITRSVLEGNYKLSPRLKALFLTRKARALAQGGDDTALRLLPEIRSLFLDGVGDTDPAWAWWIDERELAWHEAMILRDLGSAGQAITHFERSVAATPATEIRSQYLHRAYLLQAQVDNSTWDDAGHTIRQILPLATEVASTRTAVLLRTTLRQLAQHHHTPPALQEQATTLAGGLLDGFEQADVVIGRASVGRGTGTGGDLGAEQFPSDTGTVPAGGNPVRHQRDRRADRHLEPIDVN